MSLFCVSFLRKRTMKLLVLSSVWLLKEKMFFPKGHYKKKKKNLSRTLLFCEKDITTKWNSWHFSGPVCILLSTTSTVVAGRDAWIWGRSAGGCLTSVFVSELSKGTKGLLSLFSCAPVSCVFLTNEFSKRTRTNRNWTLGPLFAIDFVCL